jgi:hypothetical protein
MMMTKTMLGTAAALAVMVSAAPATAQRYGYNSYGYSQPAYGYSQQPSYGYGYSQQNYGYSQPYGYAQRYGYSNGYAMNTSVATQQCTAAVQNRLANRASIGGIIGALLGTNTTGQVVGITRVSPRGNGMTTVRGLASSGRYAMNSYGPYGVGAYGALGYGAQSAADLSFRCDVDYQGYVRDVDINRR